MTQPTLAPFFRRDGTPRELTFGDYVTITKMPRGKARQALLRAVEAGDVKRASLRDRTKTSVFSVVRDAS